MKKPGKKTKLYILLIIACLAIALWAVYARLSPKPPPYEIIDLGDFGKSETSMFPAAINDSGQVTGTYFDKNEVVHAFIYDYANGFKDIGSLGDHIKAYDINNKGQITGIAVGADGNDHLFIWDQVNGITDLGLCQLYGESQTLINNNGQVVGNRENPNGRNSEAFICDKENGFKLLGTLGGKDSEAHAINDKGQVVGQSQTAEGEEHAFIWDDANGMTDLGTLGGDYSTADFINNRGKILGYSNKPGSDPSADFPIIWDNKQISELEILPKDASVHSLNDQGQLVGSYSKKRISWTRLKWPWLEITDYSCPFVWSQQNGFIDLSGIFAANDEWQEDIFVEDINNKGQILGFGLTKDDKLHILILNPKERP